MGKPLKILFVCREWGYSQLFGSELLYESSDSVLRILPSIKQAKDRLSEFEYGLVIVDLEDNLTNAITGISSSCRVCLLTSNKPAFDADIKSIPYPVFQRPFGQSEIRQFIKTDLKIGKDYI